MRVVAALLGSVLLLSPTAARGASEARDFGAVFAPDGRTVAFVHTVGDVGSIDLVDRDGSHRRTLVPRVSAEHLAWSPDGRSLAYDDGQSSIWRVDLHIRTPVRLTSDDPSQLIERPVVWRCESQPVTSTPRRSSTRLRPRFPATRGGP